VINSGGIRLRARLESDVPVLHSELYDDVLTRSRADPRPWRPVAAESKHSPYAIDEPSDSSSTFAVVETATQELAGQASLWGIDRHNRTAHLGISLRPAVRGRGLGTDVVNALCEYGFVVLGLHRLQIETLADNIAMMKAATRAGFTLEGTMRGAAWVYGAFIDEVILGQLSDEWKPRDRPATEDGGEPVG
jgi:RimJ/RimL family protein N-acetyltransferase